MSFDQDEVKRHYAQLAPRYNQGANQVCRQVYVVLAQEALAGCGSILEVGAGADPLSLELPEMASVHVDLSIAMLRHANTTRCIAASGAALPFSNACFDGFLCVNVLEHVPEPRAFLREAARVLKPGGRLLAITPNGDHTRTLHLLERLRLKLPEGPHRFLSTRELHAVAAEALHVRRHSAFLAFPAGPQGCVRAVDRLAGKRLGLFQYVVAEKPA